MFGVVCRVLFRAVGRNVPTRVNASVATGALIFTDHAKKETVKRCIGLKAHLSGSKHMKG